MPRQTNEKFVRIHLRVRFHIQTNFLELLVVSGSYNCFCHVYLNGMTYTDFTMNIGNVKSWMENVALTIRLTTVAHVYSTIRCVMKCWLTQILSISTQCKWMDRIDEWMNGKNHETKYWKYKFLVICFSLGDLFSQ